jgi:ADP-heptose:LPS heptosyltransferase
MQLAGEIRKIIVFRALQLGDMLCAVPAIRALKKAYPNATITLAGLPWAKSFTQRFNHYFDDFIWFPGFPGLPEQPVNPPEFPRFLNAVQERHFDLALQMQGNGTLVNPMMELFGSRLTGGYYVENDYRCNEAYFMTYPDFGSEIERHLLLMNFLGIPSDGVQLEFPLTPQDQKDFDAMNLPIEKKLYVCIHPGSRGTWRQWPVEYFAAIADECAEKGYQVVVTGTKDELDIANSVMRHMKNAAINAAGKSSLGAIGLLIQNAALLVSNCTGVSHIASAVKTPSVVLSMDGEPERWGPMDKRIHHTINWLTNPDYQLVSASASMLLHQMDQSKLVV